MDLHDRIRQARKAAGISQERLGEAVGVTKASVSAWERPQGKRDKASIPDAIKLIRIAEVLNVRPEWIVNGGEMVPFRNAVTQPAPPLDEAFMQEIIKRVLKSNRRLQLTDEGFAEICIHFYAEFVDLPPNERFDGLDDKISNIVDFVTRKQVRK